MVMVKVPARPGLDPSRVRSDNPSGQQRAVPSRSRPVRGSARQRSGPSEPRPAGVPSRESRTPSSPDPPGSRPVEGSFGPSPGQPKGCSVKVSARRGFVRSPSPGQQRAVPSRSRPVRGSACQGFGPPEPRLAGVPPREGRPTPPRQSPHRTFSPFLPLHVLLLSSTAPTPLTPPTPRPSILRSGAAEPQGPRFDRRGWNRPSQDVERDFGCGAESCRRVGGSVAEASG